MATGIPGLRGAEHIGFTVPDIEQAHSFFVDVIGCDFVYKLGPWKKDDNWFTEHLNIDARSVLKELRFYRCNFGPNFEVFEFDAPYQHPTPPLNSDVCGHHIAFYVDDMDIAVSYLKENVKLIMPKAPESKPVENKEVRPGMVRFKVTPEGRLEQTN